MYLKLKRADSVTSILLFLFNVFLLKQGTREISVKKILKLLEPFNKTETSIRMGLSRGVKNGLLVNIKRQGEVLYGLTPAAEKSFEYWWETMEQFREKVTVQRSGWDGTWTLVYSKGNVGEVFLERLRKFRFGILNKNLWISPYNLTRQIFDLAKELQVTKEVHIFRSVLDENLSPGDLVNEIWQPNIINKKYKKFIINLNEPASGLGTDSKGSASLPVLHRYGMNLFHIIQDDPQLPLILLPKGWMAIEAFQSFNSFREKHLPEATAYINQILMNG